jgi:hypothetical protein
LSIRKPRNCRRSLNRDYGIPGSFDGNGIAADASKSLW